jgi:Transposase DDE domain
MKVRRLLADGWQPSAKSLGALRRRRKIRNPSQLLHLLMIYLAGYSLREATALACSVGIAQLTDTALVKRLRNAVSWLHFLARGLLQRSGQTLYQPDWLGRFKVRCVDATVVNRPGSPGTDWRLHFSWGLCDLSFEQFRITDQHVGESLCNFTAQPGDLLIGDRIYASVRGLRHIVAQGGDGIVRLGYQALATYDLADGGRIDLLHELARLRVGEVYERRVNCRDREGNLLTVRICAVRLTRAEARRAQRVSQREAKRKGTRLSAEALRWQRYLVVATTVARRELSARRVLLLYRMRWQIEVTIKRLKSIIGLGQVPCRDVESGRAWLHGKLVLALLIQVLVNQGQELHLIAASRPDGKPRVARRRGNLWRETHLMMEWIKVAIVWGNVRRLRQRWREEILDMIEERPRKRRVQHDLLWLC